jgi:transmembrane sensor
VTLLNGRVAVVNDYALQGVTLQPGQQLVAADEGGQPTLQPANLENISAWESGQLAFDSEPLSSVVERLNRYSARKIEIADARTAALEVSGLFNAGDVDGFVGTVTYYLPLTAERGRSGDVQLKLR